MDVRYHEREATQLTIRSAQVHPSCDNTTDPTHRTTASDAVTPEARGSGLSGDSPKADQRSRHLWDAGSL